MVARADLFVSPISYVTGTEREQGTSSSHQQPFGSVLQQECGIVLSLALEVPDLGELWE